MQRQRTSGSTVGIVAMLVLMLVLLLYAPSVGPAAWLQQRGLIPEAMFYVYLPLEWAADKSPHFESLASWYLDLWTASEVVVPPACLPAAPPPPAPSPALPSPPPYAVSQ